MCMGCGKGGRPITFYQQIKNISFEQAAKELGEKLGIKVESNRQSSKHDLEYQIMNRANEFFQFTLFNTKEGLKALDYLHQRGLSDETIKHFEIGLASSDFQSLSKMLVDQSYDPSLLIKLGLSTKSEKNQELYDIFNSRIMFPIKDSTLNVIGFSGRALNKDEQVKYINSQETPLFKKSDTIYHLFENLEVIKEKNEVFLFEGFFDVIQAYQIGYEIGIATMGTALTESQVRLIKNHVSTVLIAYDGDKAGIEAAHKAIPKLKKANLNVNILRIPNGLDPDDYIQKHQRKGFEKLLQTNVKDSYRYYFDELLLRLDKNNANSVQVFVRDVNLLFQQASPIIQKMFEAEITKILNFEFTFQTVKVTKSPLPEVSKPKKKILNKYTNAENNLIFELLRRKNHLDLIAKSLIPNVYITVENYQILNELVKYYQNRDYITLSEFLPVLSENLRTHLETNMKDNFNWLMGIVLEESTVINHITIIKEYDQKREEEAIYAEMDPNNEQKALELLDRVTKLKRNKIKS